MTEEERLKEYLNRDEAYQDYKKGATNLSDFEKFCVEHCKDIETILNKNEELEAKLKLHEGALKREHEAIHRANDLEKKVSLLNKMNEENYEKYCNELKKNKEAVNEINRFIEIIKSQPSKNDSYLLEKLNSFLYVLGSDSNE